MKKPMRIFSFILACLTVICVFPTAVFATESAPEAQANTWTDEDYEALYVTDADGKTATFNYRIDLVDVNECKSQ